jgi:hypothetical protein
MDLSKILAISGKPGLYKSLTQSKNGFIVESLQDGKRFTAFASERISTLEEISIYTESEDIPLKDVFKMIFEKKQGEAAVTPASQDEIKTDFENILPNYDRERVYVSDIRKVFNWYNTLLEHKLLDFTDDKKDEDKEPADVEEPGEPDKKSEKAATTPGVIKKTKAKKNKNN